MGKFLHKYRTIEEFEAAYQNEGQVVATAITISVSAGTYVFDHQEYGGGFYWKDSNNNEAWTEKRFPAVGDEAYDITASWARVTVASVLTETPEATYIEPWVSLTLEGLPKKVKIYCHGTGYYHGMEYIGPDNTYGDYYKWIEIDSEGEHLTQLYYTTTRKLKPGDPVYWSMEGGVDMHEPCAWVDSFLEGESRVDYNKVPEPSFLEILWETSGFTNPMPQKVLLNYMYNNRYDEPGLSESTDIEHTGESNPLNNWVWYDFSEAIALGKYRIVDASDFTRADWDDANSIGIYFLWELDENGWPSGWTEYPSGQGEGLYGTNKDPNTGDWELWGTSVLKCCKLEANGTWYGYGIYGD